MSDDDGETDPQASSTILGRLLETVLVEVSSRAGLLAHALWAASPAGALRPLGLFCGPSAFENASLGSALFCLSPPGTGLSRAAIRERRPVWIPSIADVPSFARGGLLGRYAIRSGAAFPVAVGKELVAIVEVLSFHRLERDPGFEAVVHRLEVQLEVASALRPIERAKSS